MTIDYSLYLVTDSTHAVLGDKDLISTVAAAIEGGVTVVQFRDKKSDTAELVRTARRLHAITERYNVPLLINDRVDVAQAIGAEGVHLGQDDMGRSFLALQTNTQNTLGSSGFFFCSITRFFFHFRKDGL